jgi:hypothetical protein
MWRPPGSVELPNLLLCDENKASMPARYGRWSVVVCLRLRRREAEPPTLLLASPSVTTSWRCVSPRRHRVPLTSVACACAGGGGQARRLGPSGEGWWARTTGQGPMRTCPAEVGLDPHGLGDGGRRQHA